MSEIICPNCNKPFHIDESGYAEIVRQVTDQEFRRQLNERTRDIESRYESELEHERADHQAKLKQRQTELEAQNQRDLLELRNTVDKLTQELKVEREQFGRARELAVLKATSDRDLEIEKLKSEINSAQGQREQERAFHDQQLIELTSRKDSIIRDKDDEIERLRNQKARLSTKMLGETLEQHCETEFNLWRSRAFPNVEFHKDNDASEGSKGDYIFREFDEDGVELISIMFEMKNEADTTKTKHKNEDFLKKLDSDRSKKGCEYAVLVSLLEPENEFYNSGIADLSHIYDKMYAIRPQFFIPIISLLRNSARANLELRKELIKQQQENIDITNFENAMVDFKDKFGKNVGNAKKKFDEAIDEIDKTIKHLEKVKENLLSSERQLELADKKAQDLSIRKLTKNSPSVRRKFDELKEGQSSSKSKKALKAFEANKESEA